MGRNADKSGTQNSAGRAADEHRRPNIPADTGSAPVTSQSPVSEPGAIGSGVSGSTVSGAPLPGAGASGSDVSESGAGPTPLPDQLKSLISAARAIVSTADLDEKVALAKHVAKLWFSRRLSLGHLATSRPMPERPGRPERPELLPPRAMPKRSTRGKQGRLALLHSLAHIELNAIDMTWDLIGRFIDVPMPQVFYDNWVQVGLEEAKHFEMLAKRLIEIDSFYGALPAHDGLWQAAQATGHDLLARVAIVPLVLEARGLDVTPPMIKKFNDADDKASAKILEIIYRDEKRHVAFGAKWFRFLCDRAGLSPEPTFHSLVRANFKGAIKPPFNDEARIEAGLTPGFYKPLIAPIYKR